MGQDCSGPLKEGAVPSPEPSRVATAQLERILQVPVNLLRFHQPMAEHGPGACAQPIGEAAPPGHCQFRSSSD